MAHRRAPTSATRSTPRTGAKTRAMSSNIGDRELAPELTLPVPERSSFFSSREVVGEQDSCVTWI